MKHENGNVDTRFVTRVSSGALALLGLWAMGHSILRFLEEGVDAAGAAVGVGALFGTWLFARYALTGRLSPPAPERRTD